MSARVLVMLVLVGCSSDGGDYRSGDTPPGYDTGATWNLTTTDGDSDTPVAEPAEGADTPSSPECDATNPVTLYVSPDDSNSMSSPAQARLAVLDDWANLRDVPIRTFEFMNYYRFDYEAPPEGELRITPTLADNGDGTWTFQVALTSAARSNADRAPMNLTLSIDTSGSMDGEPLEQAQEVARALASSLKVGDVISMTTWSTTSSVLLDGHEVSGPDDPTLLAAIDRLSSNGGTDLYNGLVSAYALAEAHRNEERINRVILISDGGANLGITEEEVIAGYAASNDQSGIYLVGVGVGTADSYHDTLMDRATDVGRGASVFVGEPEAAWSVFGERAVTRTLDVAWRNVNISLDLPPGFEIERFSGEEVSTNPEEIHPQHLAPDDSMVFYMTLSTCSPETVTEASTITVNASFADPITLERKEATVSRSFAELAHSDQRLLRKGAAVFSYAEGLKAWKSAGNDEDRASAIEHAIGRVELALEQDPEDDELEEIWTVLHVLE